MAQPPDARLTPELALGVCERTASAAVLDGSIARLGTQYVVGLRAKNCRTGALLDEEQSQTARKEDVLATLGRMARPFRRRLGESLSTIEKYDTPLPDATTASLDAFRAYAAGMHAWSSTGSASAIPLFRHAVELDPGFAVAHAWLGRVYGDIGEFAQSADSTTKAYQLRARVSQPEQYFISASYDLQITGNLEKARRTCESWAEVYPRAFGPHSFLAGIILPALGAFDGSVSEARKTIDADPGFWVGYYLLAYGNQYQNRFADAEQALDAAARRGLEVPEFIVERYDLAFLKSDPAAMDSAVARAATNLEAAYLLDDHRAFVLANAGRLREAGAVAERAAAIALQSGEQERAAQFQTAEALWDGFVGDAPAAVQAAVAALERSSARDVEYGAAMALALALNDSRAIALATDLEHRFPEDTDAKFRYVPAIRALVAVNEGRASQAIDLLQLAVPYELAPPRSSMHGFFGALYPVYVRGLAYLALHRGADAAAEFQKILDRPGIVVSDPVAAAARTQLARARAMTPHP
jgi:tetratricopeptide (TPR) repeat protein